MKRLIFHTAAEQELLLAGQYYTEIDSLLGHRFSVEIEWLLSNICNAPQRYPMYDAPIRRHFSTVFPYAILYVDRPDDVLVVAVMHMSRDPGYWRGRVE